jgi:two-component system, NarL family, sensor histidine kinase UhpB
MSILYAAGSASSGRAGREAAATPERDHARMIAARLPIFAILWLGHDTVWAVLRVRSGMAEPQMYASHLAVVAFGFGAAILVARRNPTARYMRWVAVAACLLAATASAVTEARMHAYSEVVRGSHSFVVLGASLLFAWGWAAASVLVVGSCIAFWAVQSQLQFFLPPQDLWVAYGTASLIAIGLAEISARGFRTLWYRRQAEQGALAELEASRNAYRDLAENARDMIWLLDIEGRILYANEAVARYRGVPPSEVVGSSVLEMITDHPRNPDVRAVLGRIVHGETVPPLLFQIAPRPGHPDIRWHEVLVSAVLGPEGAVTGIRGISRDVSERVQAEEQLRASEERFGAAFAASSVGLTITDSTGRALQLNDAICTMLGHTRAELMTMTIDDVTHPDDRATANRERQCLLAGERRSFTLETRFIRRDGQVMWGLINVSALRDARGTPVALIALVQDITERRLADDALRRSHDKLHRNREKLRRLARQQAAIREEERKRLGLDLHDDVCQELVGMSIMIESLRRRLEPVSAGDAAELARIGQLATSVGDHLRLLAHEMRPVQLGDLGLEGSLRSLGNGLSADACAIAVRFSTPVPRLDEETEVGVYRIAQEALTNAIRHAGTSRIELVLAVEGDLLQLEVRDWGRGFTVTESSEGLGLFSMGERALALGGRLDVRSEPGEGTTVHLMCPLRDGAAAEAS